MSVTEQCSCEQAIRLKEINKKLLEVFKEIANHEKYLFIDTPLIDAVGSLQSTVRVFKDMAINAIKSAEDFNNKMEG